MMMAADGIFQWSGRERGAAPALQEESVLCAPALMPPQLVAEALFAELGLDRFLAPAVTPGERLIGDILLFAAGEPATALPLAEQAGADSAPLSAPAVEPAAGPAMPEPDERYRADASHMSDGEGGEPADIAATSGEIAADGEPAWLGLDMSEPREWSADDLAMLIYRDCADVADSLARRVGRAMSEGEAFGLEDSDHDALADESLDALFSRDRFAA